MASRKGIRAWLVSWEWDGEHARYEGEQRYLIIGPRRSAKYVADVMERLYAQSQYTLGEQASLAAGRWKNPYPATIGHWERITCGHNPFLFGRPVKDLRVEAGEDGVERLVWEDLPIKQEWRDFVARVAAENRGEVGRLAPDP